MWPVRGPVLARFAYRATDPFTRGQRRGIDIGAPAGTPVVAACAGRVRFSGAVGTSGRTVSVACAPYVVSYLHLDALATRRGARLDAGDAVGTVGTTGRRHERRPHLSFGVRRASDRWGYVDPLRLLPRAGAPPSDLAPTTRARRSPAPLGPAPASERRPVPSRARVPTGDPRPSLVPGPASERRPSLGPVPAPARHRPLPRSRPPGLPLGSLWLPAGGALVLVAAGAPLVALRRRRRRRNLAPPPSSLHRRAA
jgi:hypothetical protein